MNHVPNVNVDLTTLGVTAALHAVPTLAHGLAPTAGMSLPGAGGLELGPQHMPPPHMHQSNPAAAAAAALQLQSQLGRLQQPPAKPTSGRSRGSGGGQVTVSQSDSDADTNTAKGSQKRARRCARMLGRHLA